MKTTIKTSLALLALAMAAFATQAQDNGAPPDGGRPNGGPDGPRGHRHPPMPLFMALDVNHDGIIDSNEIANASAELLTLDTNKDGQLTPDEYLPPRPKNADDMGQNFRPPPSPLVRALDVNHDGIIDASEIANAPAELKTLDKNGDGQLTRDEIRPPRRHHGNEGNGPDGGNSPDANNPPGGGSAPDGGPPVRPPISKIPFV